MFPNVFNATSLPVLQEVIGFSQARHELLAGNVANMDTPGYRVRDLSVENFQQRLKEAVESRGQSRHVDSPGMLPVDESDPMREVRESMKSILYHDDSDVGLEQQVTEMSKNQFMHNLAVTLLSSQVRLLQTAISERV